MNTGERDGLGRMIYKGPRGGRYVLGARGQRLEPATGRATRIDPRADRNDLGREILRGERGWYVRDERGHVVPPVIGTRPRTAREPHANRAANAANVTAMRNRTANLAAAMMNLRNVGNRIGNRAGNLANVHAQLRNLTNRMRRIGETGDAAEAARATRDVLALTNRLRQMRLAAAAPPANARADEAERRRLVESLREECYNDEDPVLMERFEDMDLRNLRNVVRLGRGPKKHCFALNTAYQVYKTARESARTPKNPMTAEHMTQDELNNINAKMLRRNATYRPPRRDPGVLDRTARLEFVRTAEYDGRGYWSIAIVRPNREPEDLGYVPEFDVHETGSAQDTTAVLLANLGRLFDEGRLLVRRADGGIGCCTVHLRKTLSYWSTDALRKFLNMTREIRDAL